MVVPHVSEIQETDQAFSGRTFVVGVASTAFALSLFLLPFYTFYFTTITLLCRVFCYVFFAVFMAFLVHQKSLLPCLSCTTPFECVGNVQNVQQLYLATDYSIFASQSQ